MGKRVSKRVEACREGGDGGTYRYEEDRSDEDVLANAEFCCKSGTFALVSFVENHADLPRHELRLLARGEIHRVDVGLDERNGKEDAREDDQDTEHDASPLKRQNLTHSRPRQTWLGRCERRGARCRSMSNDASRRATVV